MMRRQRNQKKKKRHILRNTFIFLLVLVSLALIFNTSIRNMIIAWYSNHYQISKVSKEDIDKNKNADVTFDFNQVESISTEAVLKAQWEAQQLPVIGGIAIPELGINLPIFKGLSNVWSGNNEGRPSDGARELYFGQSSHLRHCRGK